MKSIAMILLVTVVGGCSVSQSVDDPNCAGKCETFEDVIWRYDAGEVPWVTCANDNSRVTCQLADSPDPVRPTKVVIGKDDPIYFPQALTEEAPEYVLPEYFSRGSTINLAARPPGSWTGDVIGQLTIPSSGSSATQYLPYDVWRVTVTKLDESEVSLHSALRGVSV